MSAPSPALSPSGDAGGRDEAQRRFAAELARLEHRLAVPYPDRALLLDEMAADLAEAYRSLRAGGAGPDEAQQGALSRVALDESALRALDDIHMPALRRTLARCSPPLRSWVEALGSAVPLAVMFGFLATEVPLHPMLKLGGGAAYLVLLVGATGLFLQLQRFFIWFVLRDHSALALRRNTTTPLFLATAAMLLGVLGTALAYWSVLLQRENGQIQDWALSRLIREPLACLIVGSSLAGLIVLGHGALLVGLRALRVPERSDPSESR